MAESTQISNSEIPMEEWLPSALPTTVVHPTPETHVSILDDKAILLNLDTGAYHALNPVGTFIWERFTPEHSLRDIHTMMCEHYEVEGETAKADLIELVTHLNRLGLVDLDRQS